MSKARSAKQVLIATKSMLENIGWNKGAYVLYEYNGGGTPRSFCLSGALNRVEGISNVKKTALAILYKLSSRVGVVCFNDAERTTKEDVLALLDKAIKQCDKKPKRKL